MLRNKLVRAAAVGGLLVGSMMPAGLAFADYGDPDTDGSGNGDTGGSGDSSGDGSGLPVTGGDIVGMTVIGGALALGGTVLVRSGRRKSVTA